MKGHACFPFRTNLIHFCAKSDITDSGVVQTGVHCDRHQVTDRRYTNCHTNLHTVTSFNITTQSQCILLVIVYTFCCSVYFLLWYILLVVVFFLLQYILLVLVCTSCSTIVYTSCCSVYFLLQYILLVVVYASFYSIYFLSQCMVLVIVYTSCCSVYLLSQFILLFLVKVSLSANFVLSSYCAIDGIDPSSRYRQSLIHMRYIGYRIR